MAKKTRAADPVETALARLLVMIGRGASAARIERELEAIAAEWKRAAEPSEFAERLEAVRNHVESGVHYAEEQLADADNGEAAALKLAQGTLMTMRATRDAAARLADAAHPR